MRMVTGVAGFIGFHLGWRMLEQGQEVLGIDNLNDYYDVSLKQARLEKLLAYENFHFQKLDLLDKEGLKACFANDKVSLVIHLAAQAGVRYAMENPDAYIDSNIVGFMNLLELCRAYPVEHFVYASSSSVYGANSDLPLSTQVNCSHPLSLYAATKRSNELMAHSYAHLYGIPSTGLRFFTVYGPWGRPDMALFRFTKAILQGETIELFYEGKHRRDFTYIDDVSDAVLSVLDKPFTRQKQWSSRQPDASFSDAPWRLYNIGSGKPIMMSDCVALLEHYLEKKAYKRLLPIQAGEVRDTWAAVGEPINLSRPKIDFEQGVAQFVQWYKTFYGV